MATPRIAPGPPALPGPLDGRLPPGMLPRSALPLRDSPGAPSAPGAPTAAGAPAAVAAALAAPQLLHGVVRAARGGSDPLADVRILTSYTPRPLAGAAADCERVRAVLPRARDGWRDGGWLPLCEACTSRFPGKMPSPPPRPPRVVTPSNARPA